MKAYSAKNGLRPQSPSYSHEKTKQPPKQPGTPLSTQERQQKEQSIRLALAEGRLYMRGVRTEPAYGRHQLGETEQHNPRRIHRAASCIKQGHPLFHKESGFLKDALSLYILLIDCKPILYYKRDVGTMRSLTRNAQYKHLSGRVGLHNKMIEQHEKWADVYPLITSGHLTTTGQFVSGHKKNSQKQINPENLPPYPEVLIEPYLPSQYAGILICDFFQSGTWNKMLTSLRTIQQLEGCPTALPLVFFNERCGKIRQILWSDQLPCSLDNLQQNINSLCQLLTYPSGDILNEALPFFPPLQRIEALLQGHPHLTEDEPLPSFDRIAWKYGVTFDDLSGTSPGWPTIIQLFRELPNPFLITPEKAFSIETKLKDITQALHQHRLSEQELNNLLGVFAEYRRAIYIEMNQRELDRCFSEVAITLHRKGGCCHLSIPLVATLPELAFRLFLDQRSTQRLRFADYPEMINILIENVDFIKKHQARPVISLASQLSSFPDMLDTLTESNIYTFIRLNISDLVNDDCSASEHQHAMLRTLNSYKIVIRALVQMGAQADIERLQKHAEYLQPDQLIDLDPIACKEVPECRKFLESFSEATQVVKNDYLAFINELKLILESPQWHDARSEFSTRKPFKSSPSHEYLLNHFSPSQPEPDMRDLDYEELGEQALDFYYRKTRPEMIAASALTNHNRSSDENLPRRSHGVDHVVRTWIIAEALLPLFEKHDQAVKTLLAERPQLRELIPLALVWHDVVAEDKPKNQEEAEAARLFEWDMSNTTNTTRYSADDIELPLFSGPPLLDTRYNADDIELVARALHNKNNRPLDKRSGVPSSALAWDCSDEKCSPEERLVRHLIRLPDCIDIVRTMSVSKDWNNLDTTFNHARGFNPAYLDIPDRLRTNSAFKHELAALMKGAKDLAWVTGGRPRCDNAGDPYNQRYHLQINNQAIRKKVHYSANAKQTVMQALDDNVRRWYARTHLGLNTCQADHSKETLKRNEGRATCLTTVNGHDRLTAIHSTTELRQIRLPANLTTTEKLQVESLGLSDTVLRECHALNHSIKLQHGILPLLGTLRQDTLQSPAAQEVLRQRQYKVIEKQISYFEEYEFTDRRDTGTLKKVHEIDKRPESELSKKQLSILEAVPIDKDE